MAAPPISSYYKRGYAQTTYLKQTICSEPFVHQITRSSVMLRSHFFLGCVLDHCHKARSKSRKVKLCVEASARQAFRYSMYKSTLIRASETPRACKALKSITVNRNGYMAVRMAEAIGMPTPSRE